jgi:hypothetical protein
MKKSYQELEEIMNQSSGAGAHHELYPFYRTFIVTDGVKYFAEEAEAHWLIDIVGTHLPIIAKTEDYFFTVELNVNKEQKNEGIFAIFHEISGEKVRILRQNIPYVNLPSGQYKFFLFHEEEYFIMICPSEY